MLQRKMNNMWYVILLSCDLWLYNGYIQIPGEVKDEVSLAGRKSIETVKSVSGTLYFTNFVCI